MQDNELDKLINDAANQHHPPYDDESWGKMLVLLDKHLPEKKDRRKPFVFWLLLLLLGITVTVVTLQPWKNNGSAGGSLVAKAKNTGSNSIAQKNNPAAGDNSNTAVPGNALQNEGTATATTDEHQSNATVIATHHDEPVLKQPANTVNRIPSMTTAGAGKANDAGPFEPAGKTSIHRKARSVVKIKQSAATEEADDPVAVKESKNIQDKTAGKPGEAATTPQKEETGKVTVTQPETGNETADADKKTSEEISKQKEPVEKKEAIVKNTTAGSKAAGNTKKDHSFASKFALTFSTGADMSFVDLKNPGKVKLFYGAGAAYAIGSHLKVASGFYVSKKVYSAEPYQYKFPNGAVYPHLTGIDANCTVYEIPLNVYYSFKQHKNHSWFAGAGISSLLMKKEYYNYLYQTPGGQSYSYAKTITDENKHYFSILTVSGGYQYTLSSRLALLAEPYLKLPLAGVGAGKIKLNSSGILLSAAIKPFGKAKK